ncbi:sugar ABC transporter permease [Chloroflexia bacterium SDU3-3]|nr:sugar ABC transporter permease [Chloroflexia bacterium SDU3-3]
MNLRRPSAAALALQYAILALGLIFSVFPIYFVIQAALRPGNQLYSTELQLLPTNPTFDNFRDVLTRHDASLNLPLWLWNSIKIAGVTTVVTLIMTVAAGYALSRFKFRGRGGVLTGMLALQAFPASLALPAYYLLLNWLGLLDSHWGLILVYASGAIVFNVWNLKGYFDTIPIDLEEAAMIDGATPTQAFLMVMLPLARPAIAVTALFGFLSGFGDFIVAQTVLFDPNKYTATVGVFALQDGYRNPWGLFAACALIISLPVTVLFLYLQRNLVSGLSAGGVKG